MFHMLGAVKVKYQQFVKCTSLKFSFDLNFQDLFNVRMALDDLETADHMTLKLPNREPSASFNNPNKYSHNMFSNM